MTDIASLSRDDINHPDHKAEPAELFMGIIAALSALATAAVLTQFRPKRK